LRRIVHISDLHFGRIAPGVLPALAAAIGQPDLLVVSGDLTQRAKDREFAQAEQFLRRLSCPQIVVPGNHDVPFYNVVARWLTPLRNFRRHFGDDLQPSYTDSEIAVVGINTARAATFKNGRINKVQVAGACSRFASLAPTVLRIVATHHPFAAATGDRLGRAAMAMEGFAQCGVDVVLSGHTHSSDVLSSAGHYPALSRHCLFVQAGTATSTRGRGEANAFNTLTVEDTRLTVARMTWSEASQAFEHSAERAFERTPGGWRDTPVSPGSAISQTAASGS
jgi:3',5'-cyclic AMP phosphodiesterase CpdA